jgi:citronellol/citronellal dehydrogenase
MNPPQTFGFSDDELQQLPTVYRAIACLFARLGARLMVIGRDAEKIERAAAFLTGLGAEVAWRAMTIRDADAVEALMDEAWERFGRLDVLVNNAGGQYPQAAIDFSVKGWNAVIDTNLNGSWYMMQAAARRWRDAGRPGNVVNIVADIWRGLPGIAHTAAARAGVIYLSKTIAVEWAPLGIRVNCVAPGCCETEGFGVYPAEGVKSYHESNPMLHVGDAHDVAEACVYLAAPSAKFVTGEVLTVDGGQQMWGDPWPTGRPEYFKLKD